MKKRIFLLLVLIVTVFVTGCGRKGYEEISYKDLKSKVENSETVVLFIGRETCSACSVFKGVLNDKYAKEYSKEATIYYIDLDKLSDDEKIEFNSTYYFSATPTVTILENGKFSNQNSVTGSDQYDEMIKKMKEKGILKG